VLELSARMLRNWSKTPAFQRALGRERARSEPAQAPGLPRRGQPQRRARRSPDQQQPVNRPRSRRARAGCRVLPSLAGVILVASGLGAGAAAPATTTSMAATTTTSQLILVDVTPPGNANWTLTDLATHAL
jgi:hypothetical protein